ncbi:MAG TPA: amidohydrolase family protein [Candidatus Dormibacteraeota bacterium]|nr:amidohydrolase family protein [Candidatus Dormibacteraeota bacterium]
MPRSDVRPQQVQSPRGRKSLTVDVHCHILTAEVESLVAGCPEKQAEQAAQLRIYGPESIEHNRTLFARLMPQLTGVDERLRRMDEMGVDVQLISPSPNQYYYWAEVDLAKQIVATQNEHIALVCGTHPERLRGLGNVSLQHPELSVEQLSDCVNKFGLRGVEISSACNGLELSDVRFERFWAKAEELGCLVFIHPLGTSLGDRVNRYYLGNIIGQPLETTVALSHLIFGGVLDRFPGLKICAAHGGGYLPSYVGRSDHGYAVRPEAANIKLKPSEYLKRIYYDSLVYTPEGLRHLIEQVGVAQVMIGTDYPFDMGSYDPHGQIADVPGISQEERDRILGGNAARLLGIDAGLTTTA